MCFFGSVRRRRSFRRCPFCSRHVARLSRRKIAPGIKIAKHAAENWRIRKTGSRLTPYGRHLPIPALFEYPHHRRHGSSRDNSLDPV